VTAFVSTLGAFGAITHTEATTRETERMQRLAIMKYQELVATGQWQTLTTNGDFNDFQLDGYTWSSNATRPESRT